MTTTDQPIIIPTCPSWCTRPAGHGFDETLTESGAHLRNGTVVETGSPCRGHVGDDTGLSAYPVQDEALSGGRIVQDDPYVAILVPDTQLTVDEARALAAEIVRAANALAAQPVAAADLVEEPTS